MNQNILNGGIIQRQKNLLPWAEEMIARWSWMIDYDHNGCIKYVPLFCEAISANFLKSGCASSASSLNRSSISPRDRLSCPEIIFSTLLKHCDKQSFGTAQGRWPSKKAKIIRSIESITDWLVSRWRDITMSSHQHKTWIFTSFKSCPKNAK